jgi:hypothetical protein
MAFHYPSRHPFHPPNFQGIVDALTECNVTLSGVGTNSFTLDPSGYASNFAGVVKAIEDFNISVSGIQAGGGSVERDYLTGDNLVQGDFVYVSGLSVFKASALSGLAPFNYSAIGAAKSTGSAGTIVTIVLDGEATISGTITAESSLIPGETYYLSKYSGQITRYSTSSGLVSNSGTFQYQALVPVGKATTTTQLEVEIQPAIILFE